VLFIPLIMPTASDIGSEEIPGQAIFLWKIRRAGALGRKRRRPPAREDPPKYMDVHVK